MTLKVRIRKKNFSKYQTKEEIELTPKTTLKSKVIQVIKTFQAWYNNEDIEIAQQAGQKKALEESLYFCLTLLLSSW